jgi:hypothetical protein
VLEPSFLQPGETFEAVGVQRCTWRHVLFEERGQRGSFEIWDHRHPRTAGGTATLLDSDDDECRLPAVKLAASP